MRTLTFAGLTGALLIVVLVGLTSTVFSQDGMQQPDQPQPDQQPQVTPEQEAEMKAWQEYATPGDEHARLEKHFAGIWDADVKSTMGPPSTGTMKAEMMLGGRYLHAMFDGTAMGQPFQGAAVTGYDNAKKKYFNTWFDTMGTGMLVTEGTYDEGTKTYTFQGDMTMPDGSETKVREVTRIESDDKHVFEMYMTGPEGEMKVMEITYTRKA